MDYSFTRDKFDSNSVSKYFLSIQVCLDGFSFVIFPDDVHREPVYIKVLSLDKKSGESLNHGLSAFTEFDQKEFSSTRIIIHEKVFAMVPEFLFDERDMKAYISLNHPSPGNIITHSNSIPAAKAVVVYAVKNELSELLKKKFPSADYFHSSVPFCNMALSSVTEGCFIQCYANTFEIAVIRDKKLLLYNVFEYKNENDIVYFTLNAYKSSGLDPAESPLEISGILPGDSEAIKIAGKYIKNIRYYKPGFDLPSGAAESNLSAYYFLNHREILT